MKRANFSTSVCSHCGNYQHQGRRGGYCKLLDVEVKGSWKACPLGILAFAPAWENQEAIAYKLTTDKILV
jgi:hypothetical protein